MEATGSFETSVNSYLPNKTLSSLTTIVIVFVTFRARFRYFKTYGLRKDELLRPEFFNILNMRFEALTTVLMKMQFIWDITPCRLINSY